MQELNGEFANILRDFVNFLECLSKIDLPEVVQASRNSPLSRSKALRHCQMVIPDYSELYLDKNIRKNLVLLQSRNEFDQPQEYIGPDENQVSEQKIARKISKMRSEKEEPTFEMKLRHVKRGEHRVAEMECHVKTLRERLCRLEKLLPQNDLSENPKLDCNACSPVEFKQENEKAENCYIDKIAHKEKFLRKQIYDMECTEKNYIRQIADANKDPVKEELKTISKCDSTSSRRNREEIAEERLSLLECFSLKLTNNLQALEKNHVGLTQETQRLSQVLDETRKDCFQKPEVKKDILDCAKLEKRKLNTPNKNEPNGQCSCKVLPKCNSCVVCSCDDWEHDLESDNNEESTKKCESTKKTYSSMKRSPHQQQQCSCYEELESSSSDSDSSLRYRKMKFPSAKKRTCCNSKDEDIESNDSSDDQTFVSEESKYTCFCSKNHSHEEIVMESDNNYGHNRLLRPNNKQTERFRGGLDIIHRNPTDPNTVQQVSAHLSNPPNPIINNNNDDNNNNNNNQIVKVDELREGLERLKIRNRNLKDFLHSLKSPIQLFSKPSEVFSTTCTEVSSSYTIDLVDKSHSGLLSVVKALEDKCRSKDAIIVALADELKTGVNKKLSARGKELTSDRSNIWKSYSKKNNCRKFTKKDSAIGFLLLFFILVSHVRTSQMISYMNAVKTILKESPFKLITFINESEKISMDYYSAFQTKSNALIKRFTTRAISDWTELQLWISEFLNLTTSSVKLFFTNFTDYLQIVIVNFLMPNLFYLLPISVSIIILIFIVKFRKYLVHRMKVFDLATHVQYSNFYRSLLSTYYATVVGIIKNRLLPSRIFWLILGFCGHVLWTLISPDVFQLIYAYYSENEDEIVEQEPRLLEVVNVASDAYQLTDLSVTTTVSMIKTFIECVFNVLHQTFQSCGKNV